MKLKYQLPFN